MATEAKVKLKGEGIKELTKGLDQAADAAEDLNENLESVNDEVADVGDKGAKGMKKMAKATKLAKGGMKALKGAIIATGVGALVALIGGLVAKMMESKKATEFLETALNGIGVVMNLLFEALTPVGDLLILAFTQPQEALDKFNAGVEAAGKWLTELGALIGNTVIKQMLELKLGFLNAAVAVKEFFGADTSELKQNIRIVNNEIADLVVSIEENKDAVVAPFEAAAAAIKVFVAEAKVAIEASNDLTDRTQKLRDQQRQLNVEYGQARAEIEGLKKARDDERLSIDERIAAAEKASQMDTEFAERRSAMAQRTASLLREEIALQGESVDRLDKLAEAELAVAEAAESSAAIQTEFMTSIYGLKAEGLAREQEIADFRKEMSNQFLEGMAQELTAEEEALEARKLQIETFRISQEEKDALVLQATENFEQSKSDIEEKYRLEKEAADDKTAEEDVSRRQNTIDQIGGMMQAAMALVTALDTEADNEDKKTQKARFQRAKKMQMAGALFSTASAIIAALSAPPVGLGFPAGIPGAAIAGITGAAQIATIAKTRFDGGGATSPDAPVTGGGSGSSGSMGSQLDALIPDNIAPSATSPNSEAGGGQPPVKAYVVSREVTNAQELDMTLAHQSQL